MVVFPSVELHFLGNPNASIDIGGRLHRVRLQAVVGEIENPEAPSSGDNYEWKPQQATRFVTIIFKTFCYIVYGVREYSACIVQNKFMTFESV